MSGLLPEEALGEIPVGFATAGHVGMSLSSAKEEVLAN
jgi:hypothetical protein